MLISLVFGLFMAAIDVIALGMVKGMNIIGLKWMWIPMVIYGLQPWIFLESLKFSNLTLMNLTWDLTSDILVTLVGLFYFKEILTIKQMIGVFISFLGLIFMNL